MDQPKFISSLLEDVIAASQIPPEQLLNDDDERTRALTAARQLANALEKPANAGFAASFLPIQTLCVRIAVQLKLFHRLEQDGEKPKSSQALAASSGAEELLIIRVMRVLAAMSYVREVGVNLYAATPTSHALTLPGIQAGIIHCWDHCINSLTDMIPFFEANGYKCPTDQSNGPIQIAYGTNKPIYDIWASRPGVIENFSTFMTGVRAGRPSWLEWFPLQQELFEGATSESNAPFMVDIAGGRGQDLKAFRQRFPGSPYRLILQDLQHVVKDNGTLDGIEQMAYDFFDSQPIHGARVYFFHYTFHNWAGNEVLRILKNTAAAMKKGYSKLILNELVLPDTGCPLFPASMDVFMMGVHTGIERTEKQWKELLESAGLQVKRFWRPPGDGEGIVEAMLSD